MCRLSESAQNQLKDIKKQLQDVNWSRKNQQSAVGDRLKHLESEWVGLVSKNYEIEQALAKMEAEIVKLPNSSQYFNQFKDQGENQDNSDDGAASNGGVVVEQTTDMETAWYHKLYYSAFGAIFK